MSPTHTFGNVDLANMLGILPAPAQDPPMQQYRGLTLGQSFDLRARLKASREKPMIGFWNGAFPEVSIARMLGQAGFDFVLLDWEHTPYGLGKLGEIVKAVQYGGEGNTAAIVRVPSHEHHYIAWALDAGASGVILPHTEIVEQAKAAVRNARLPMMGGTRSIGPNVFLLGYNDGPNPFQVWDRAAVIIQIESGKGAKAADEIAAVEGVDALMLGPGDLAADLGVHPSAAWTDPRFIECVQAVSAAAKKHGKAALMPSMTQQVDFAFKFGYTMTTPGSDGQLFTKAIREALNAGHDQLKAFQAGTAEPEAGDKA